MTYYLPNIRSGNVYIFGTDLTLPKLFEILGNYNLSRSDKIVLVDWTYAYLLNRLRIAYCRHVNLNLFPLPQTTMSYEQKNSFLAKINTLEQGLWYTIGGSLPDGVYEINFCAVRNNDLYLVW